jgi:hypothetical protein
MSGFGFKLIELLGGEAITERIFGSLVIPLAARRRSGKRQIIPNPESRARRAVPAFESEVTAAR